MPSSNNPMGAAIGGPLSKLAVPNTKHINVSVADNGYIVRMQKIDLYGEVVMIANDSDELNKIVAEYLA